MTEMAMSPADIQAVTSGNNGGMFSGNGVWGFILVFFILAIAGGGFGFGNRGNCATQADITNGFNFSTIDNNLRQNSNGIAQSNYSLSNELSTFRMENANCCCNTQKQIIENRYLDERNTCNIINAVHADGEATRALITQGTMQDLRDRLAESQRNTMVAQFQLSQINQTSNIVNDLRPCPKPSYITSSPYAVYYPIPNCNNGCNCPQF